MAKKIGILTFHRAFNYGAVLQCYSLQKLLNDNIPGYKTEVIDYRPTSLEKAYSRSSFGNVINDIKQADHLTVSLFFKIIAKGFRDMLFSGKRKRFEKKRNSSIRMIMNHLPLSDIHWDDGSFIDYCSDNYDLIIVGSDAIWNSKQLEWPNMYYLPKKTKSKKFSYAASIYGMDYSLISSEEKELIKDSLADFEYVGVRDKATESFVHSIVPSCKSVCHNCDPSIFLDLKSLPVSIEEVKEKFRLKGINFDKPIIGFMCNNWLAKAVRNCLGDSFQYVAIYNWNDYSDFYLEDLTPFEWAICFSLFRATFTHYFHGTLFSLKNATLTYSIEKKSPYSNKYETKIVDVLSRLNLSDRHFYFDEMNENIWKEIKKEIVDFDVDAYKDRVAQGMKKESESSHSFVEHILLRGLK